MNKNSKCAILMAVSRHIEAETDTAIFELVRRGYAINKMYGCANVDIARSVLATNAILEGFDEIMWIDADVGFHPDDVERLRSHDLPLTCGLYPKKLSEGGLAAVVEDDTSALVFGATGGLVPIRWAGTGFFHTRREVYEAIVKLSDMKICKSGLGGILHPYFMPFALPDNDGFHFYLGDDTSFCERARQCGYKIYADTTIRLNHIGLYRYSWEDISGDRPRYSEIICRMKKAEDKT